MPRSTGPASSSRNPVDLPYDAAKRKLRSIASAKRNQAWSVPRLLHAPLEEQAKITQEAWRELDVLARQALRKALRAQGRPDGPTTREVRDLATAAGVCQSRAYPDNALQGLPVHIPASLLAGVAQVLLAKTMILPKGEYVELESAPCGDDAMDSSVSAAPTRPQGDAAPC